MAKNKNFQNPKNILITGASSGIGAALAIEYAAPNITLILTARNKKRLDETAKTCREKGAAVTAKIIDVTAQTKMENFIASTDVKTPIDLIIANAGISAGSGDKSIETTQQIHQIFNINLTGTLNTILPLIPLMAKRQKGQIALVSSLAAFRGMAGAASYSASKAAIRSYGESLRLDLEPNNIGVSTIFPGFVRSRITDANNFPMPFFMEAPKAAKIICRKLQKNKSRIAFPFPTFAMARLLGILPISLSDIILRHLPKKG